VLVVDHGPVDVILVSPGEVVVTADEVLQLHATAYDEAGDVLDVQLEWSVSGGGIIDATGRFEPREVGTWTVRAEASGVSGEATVEVVAGDLASITVIPEEATITTDEGVTFEAVGHDLDGNEVPVSPFWGIIGGGTIDERGRFEAQTVGEWPVIAQVGEVVGEATVRVGHGVLDRIVVTPGSTVMTADEEFRFSVSGRDADGNPVPISPSWSVSGGGTIDQGGTFDAVEVGEWQVEARASGLSGTSTVVVEPGELSLLQLLPGDVEMNVSETFDFTVKGFDANGNVVVPSLQWSVSGGGHVTEGGEFIATEEGTWVLQATQGDVSATSTITVHPVEAQEDPEDPDPAPMDPIWILFVVAIVIVVVLVATIYNRRPRGS
jgi:hypothetical protein